MARIRPRVKQLKEECKPSSPTTNLVKGLCLKSEKLPISMHTYTSRFDNWKRKRNIPKPSKSKRKDACLDHAEDEYYLCCHQSLQYSPWPQTNKADTSVYNYGTLVRLDYILGPVTGLQVSIYVKHKAHHLAPHPLALLPPRFEGIAKNHLLN